MRGRRATRAGSSTWRSTLDGPARPSSPTSRPRPLPSLRRRRCAPPELPPVILGAGPAGLFCALGAPRARRPRRSCVDRGKLVEPRRRDVAKLMRDGRARSRVEHELRRGRRRRVHRREARHAHPPPGRAQGGGALRPLTAAWPASWPRGSRTSARTSCPARSRPCAPTSSAAAASSTGTRGPSISSCASGRVRGARPRRRAHPRLATGWSSPRATAPASSSSCSPPAAGPSRRSRSRSASGPSTRRRSSTGSSTGRQRASPGSRPPTTSSPTTRRSTASRAGSSRSACAPAAWWCRRRPSPGCSARTACRTRTAARRVANAGVVVAVVAGGLRGGGLPAGRSPGSPGSARGSARAYELGGGGYQAPAQRHHRLPGRAPRAAARADVLPAGPHPRRPLDALPRRGPDGAARRAARLRAPHAGISSPTRRCSSGSSPGRARPAGSCAATDHQSPVAARGLPGRRGRRLRGRDRLVCGGRPAGGGGNLRGAGTSVTARASMRSRDQERATARSSSCPSLADLHALYVQGFLGDEDLVRPESSQRWVPAGAMAALRGVREKRADPRKMLHSRRRRARGRGRHLLARWRMRASCGRAERRDSSSTAAARQPRAARPSCRP